MPSPVAPTTEPLPDSGIVRRVQRTGRSSLTVSLPKSWSDSLHLEHGDELQLRDMGGSRLELSPLHAGAGMAPRTRVATIDAGHAAPHMVARLLVGAYITGQDSVIITSKGELPQALRSEVHQTLQSMLGMAIVSDEAHRLEIQIFVDPTKHRLHRLLDQLVRMLRHELASCQKAVAEKDETALASLAMSEDEVDKIYRLIVRQLLLASDDYRIARDIGVLSHHFQLGYRMVAKMLEVTGDLILAISRELEVRSGEPTHLSEPVRREFGKMLGRLDEVLACTMEAFNEVSPIKANQTLEDLTVAVREAQAVGDKLVRLSPGKLSAARTQRVVTNFVTALEMLRIVNEVTVNRAIEPETVGHARGQLIPAGHE